MAPAGGAIPRPAGGIACRISRVRPSGGWVTDIERLIRCINLLVEAVPSHVVRIEKGLKP